MKNPNEEAIKNIGTQILSRREFLAAGSTAALALSLPLGCGGEETTAGVAVEAGAAPGASWASTRKEVDLLDKLHLADFFHHGEFVDFGTAARFKYTLGGWMSGWANDTSIDGVQCTWATESPSRFYFSLPEPTALSFVMRLKRGGTDAFSVRLNGKPVAQVPLQEGDWREYRVSASLVATVAGENHLEFVYKTSPKKVHGVPASFSVDYVRIIPEGTDSGGRSYEAPSLDRLRDRFELAGAAHDSLMLSAPSRVS